MVKSYSGAIPSTQLQLHSRLAWAAQIAEFSKPEMALQVISQLNIKPTCKSSIKG